MSDRQRALQAAVLVPVDDAATRAAAEQLIREYLQFIADTALQSYRLTFDIGSFHREQGLSVSFFPEVKITFNVRDPDEHFHLPLLLSPFGYSTYRGSANIPPKVVNSSDDV